VGAITAFFAATIAMGQFDIKRVLAYSTISQLGYMVAAVGMGAFVAGIFHLIMHSFFKALLFLGAGSVIQGVEHGHHHVEKHGHGKSKPKEGPDFDPQDMRNMGGLAGRMKITFWVYLIAALAISGIPPLAGFWSKDEIITEANTLNTAVYWLLVAAAFLTAFYMGRQVMMVFAGSPRSESAANAVESPPVMTVPLIVLAVLSFFGGALNFPSVTTLSTWLEHTVGHLHEVGFDIVVSSFTAGLAIIALILTWVIYGRRYQKLLALPPAKRPDDPLRSMLGPLFTALENKWWVDEFYNAIIIKPYKSLARLMITGEEEAEEKEFWEYWVHEVALVGGFRAFTDFMALFVDLEIVDAFFNGMGEATRWLGTQLRRLQSGYVRNYALSVVLGVVIIVSYLILRR
jgi:NADH-quinone oxidoreductase subunit L